MVIIKGQDRQTETAGNLVNIDPVTVRPEAKLAEVIELSPIDRERLAQLPYILVTDQEERLVGYLPAVSLLTGDRSRSVEEVMDRRVISVRSATDQEVAAHRALAAEWPIMPVTDRLDKLIGVIPTETIFKILQHEHSEDLFYAGGVERIDSVIDVLRAKTGTLIKARLPWLVVGLFGGLLAATVVSRFEALLSQYLILAFFLPLVVYISDAVANQTVTILIRALALQSNLPIRRYIWRELGTGVILGLGLGALIGLVVWWWFSDPLIAIALSISLFLSVMMAVLIALAITLTLTIWYRDPAPGSGPFSTIIIDIVSILIYFSVASFVLGLG